MPIILDEQQQKAVNIVLKGKNVFLTGGGGTGKSFVLEHIIDIFKEKYKHNLRTYVGITSTTGSSALLIGGTTIHSFSGLGVSKEDEELLAEINAALATISQEQRLEWMEEATSSSDNLTEAE